MRPRNDRDLKRRPCISAVANFCMWRGKLIWSIAYSIFDPLIDDVTYALNMFMPALMWHKDCNVHITPIKQSDWSTNILVLGTIYLSACEKLSGNTIKELVHKARNILEHKL